ncbi:MAG: transposase, degenerate [uncultured bacterium]|nr:MAG: transposase, degenerate [uncultured bacterium]
MQRKSDGTLQISGVRFEVPARFRHLDRLHVRFPGWDLSQAYLVDERTGLLLATIRPLDKVKNSQGKRRLISPVPDSAPTPAGGDYRRTLRNIIGKLTLGCQHALEKG